MVGTGKQINLEYFVLGQIFLGQFWFGHKFMIQENNID